MSSEYIIIKNAVIKRAHFATAHLTGSAIYVQITNYDKAIVISFANDKEAEQEFAEIKRVLS